MWATALVLVILFAGAGAVLVQMGRGGLEKLGRESSDTLNSLRAGGAWAKEQIVR
jgi:hypothetical protein